MTANINTPDHWDAVYRDEWQRGELEGGSRDYGPIHDAIVALVSDTSRVLDVGCGVGLLCRKIGQARPRAHITGVDFSRYTIERDRERDAGLGIEYRCLDIRHELGTLPRGFDVVTMCEVIEHLADGDRVVAEAMALLRPGGRFVLTCPHDDEIPDPEHVRRWGHDEVFHLLARYGDEVAFRHFPPPYFHPWLLAHVVRR